MNEDRSTKYYEQNPETECIVSGLDIASQAGSIPSHFLPMMKVDRNLFGAGDVANRLAMCWRLME